MAPQRDSSSVTFSDNSSGIKRHFPPAEQGTKSNFPHIRDEKSLYNSILLIQTLTKGSRESAINTRKRTQQAVLGGYFGLFGWELPLGRFAPGYYKFVAMLGLLPVHINLRRLRARNPSIVSFHTMPHIINDIKLDFKDVLLHPKRSAIQSRVDVDLFREITFRHSKRTYKGIPVMAANMDTIGTFEMAKALSKHGMFTILKKYYSLAEWTKFAEDNPDCLGNVAPTSGTSDRDLERLTSIISAIPELSFICLDVANGYSEPFVKFVRKVRGQFPNHTIIAGNVASREIVEELILSGADIVKIGLGPGSVCTTRHATGVGCPQLSAVIECADAAHGLKAHIISDGGCSGPGDVAKAFGAGADFVMVGGILAGHDECGGKTIEKNGKKFKSFYGTASSMFMEKYAACLTEQRAPEGKIVEVPYRGKVENTVLNIIGGLKSACSYIGAANLVDLPQRATFIRCTQQLNLMYGPPV